MATIETHLDALTVPRLLVAGPLGGLLLGLVARAWMRWISTDPDFTWAGSIAIVVAFMVFATAQTVAAITRRRSGRPRLIAITRALAVVLSLGLFGAGGALMFPTVIFASLAAWRTDWHRAFRLGCALLAMPTTLYILAALADDHGWGIETLGRMLTFLLIYALIVAATWPATAPVANGWKPRMWRLLMIAVIGAPVLILALAVVGV